MSKIAIIADPTLSTTWARTLRADGHDVDVIEHSFDYQELLSGDPRDIVIFDVANPNFGETMLIPQVRAAWPDCKTIAVVSSYTFRSSAIYEMGLWSPDQLLIKPVNVRLLSATVAFLWAQIRTAEIKQIVREAKGMLDGLQEKPTNVVDLTAIRNAASDGTDGLPIARET